jgi:hypothetical protein
MILCDGVQPQVVKVQSLSTNQTLQVIPQLCNVTTVETSFGILFYLNYNSTTFLIISLIIFSFKCHNEAHAPATCEQMKLWAKESEVFNCMPPSKIFNLINKIYRENN